MLIALLSSATPNVLSGRSTESPNSESGETLWKVYNHHMGSSPSRARRFDIRHFGAQGDGAFENTKAFNDAMKEVAATPGGAEVVLPPGRWLTAPFNLTSHLTLNVMSGATLLASEDPNSWPVIAPLPSYGQGRNHRGPRRTSFLHGVNLSDVVIGGGGTIDGQGRGWWERHANGTEKYTRGRLFEVEWSDGILLQDLLWTNSPFWTLHPVYSSNIVARRLNISNPLHIAETDGFDPDSCENASFVDSFYSGGDDGVAIKSGWDCFGLATGRPTRNVYVRNLTLRTPHAAGICIGSEMSGGIENVMVHDVHMADVAVGLRVKAAKGRGAYVRNVTYSNVTIASYLNHALQINDFYGNRNPSCGERNASALPRISDIKYVDVRALRQLGQQQSSAADFEGLPLSPIQNVQLKNVVLPASGSASAPVWNCKHVGGHSTAVEPTPCPQLASLPQSPALPAGTSK